MFTGIITDLGVVRETHDSESSRRFMIGTNYDTGTIDIGASIAHNGCCLTVVEKGIDADGCFYVVDVSSHTLAHTTLGQWRVGHRINLERALGAGDELGGHIVSGHVDGMANIAAITPEDGYMHYKMSAPSEFAPYIATKGSITLDGVSLTVTWAKNNLFGLTLIPHTMEQTNWKFLDVGDEVNLEVDMLARYVKRMMEFRE